MKSDGEFQLEQRQILPWEKRELASERWCGNCERAVDENQERRNRERNAA